MSEQTKAEQRRGQKRFGGYRKAAVLLSLLPPEEAAQILRHLEEREVEPLVREMTRIGTVKKEVATKVLEDGLNSLAKGDVMPLAKGGIDKARSLLMQAFGSQQGSVLWGRMETMLRAPTSETDQDLLKKLNEIPPQQLVELIRNEHPQAIALILSLLPPSQSGAVLGELPPQLRIDVALRLLTVEPPSLEVLTALRQSLQESIAPIARKSSTVFDGIKILVQILSNLPKDMWQEILEHIKEKNPVMADQVQQAMFTFEDILKLDDRSIQRVLREVDNKDLAIALKGTLEEVREKILKNMSQRAATILREEMSYMGPMRLRDVISAQRRIVEIILRLEDAGEISVPRGGEEVLV